MSVVLDRSELSVAERVREGVKLLDAREPGWSSRINVRELDMGDEYNCVLGQLYGDYTAGEDRLGIFTEGGRGYGLDSSGVFGREYPTLQRLWVYVINSRRSGGVAQA